MGRLFGDERGATYDARTVSAGDGVKLFVRVYGARRAPAVVCLPGLTRNSKDFHPVASRLARDYRVIVPEYRGRGRSAWDPDWRRYRPETYLADIGQVVTALGVDQCAVIGTSLGGLLGMALAVAMPTCLRGLLMNDIGPDIPAVAIEPIRAFVGDARAVDGWGAARAQLSTAFPRLPARDDEDWRVIVDATYRKRPDGMLEHDWDPAIGRALDVPPPPADRLWRLFTAVGDRPFAATRGDLTTFISEDVWTEMQIRAPGLMTASIPGVGHAPSLAEDEAVALTDRWLKRCFG